MFKLSDLGKLYEHRLKEQNPGFPGNVNTTRLKERLILLVPDLKAQTQGREVMQMFTADIGQAITLACYNTDDDDDDAIHLARAAQILRKDILPRNMLLTAHLSLGVNGMLFRKAFLPLLA